MILDAGWPSLDHSHPISRLGKIEDQTAAAFASPQREKIINSLNLLNLEERIILSVDNFLF